MNPDPSTLDMFTQADGVALFFVAVALVSLALAWVVATSNVTLRVNNRQYRKDLQRAGNAGRRKDQEIRRLRWEVASLQGFQPTAVEHLCLDTYRDERPEHGPGWVGPSWCYEPLPADTPDLGAGLNPAGIRALADLTAEWDPSLLQTLLADRQWSVTIPEQEVA